VFTLLYVAVLGYIIWLYFGEFLQCKKPSVYESTTNYPILGDDPDNDLATLFPVISFLDYSLPTPWPNGLPAVPFSDITCRFRVEFAHATTGQWLFISGDPIPINKDCNAKFREMYKKKTGRDDDTISKTHYLICPDTDKLPLAGDGSECLGSAPCSYYSFQILKKSTSTAHCSPLSMDTLIVNINYINPKLTVDDFDNPWSYGIDGEWTNLSQTETQVMKIGHFYTELKTDAYSFGLTEAENVEKNLFRNPQARIDKGPFEAATNLYLWILFVPQNIHKSVSRSYISFLDAAGKVGG
jgi:hypothetical protein